jgi:hypothetical protein
MPSRPEPAGGRSPRSAGPGDRPSPNIASVFPITPGGLGVVEVTLVAITVGFGAPRPTAVLAVLGYRIVNYWLPLMPGAIAYLRLRLSPGPGRPGIPQAPPAGR